MSFVPHYSNNSANRALTHPSLHLRDAHDAQVILEAVRRNILPLIKRRLVASERDQLTAGNVFVWEEAEDEGGLLRWTDGRRWSQSRMRGDYLFYEEKVETTQEERDAKAARRARRATDPTALIPPPTRRKDRPSKPNGLTKQTYSALVYLPGAKEGRKWHVVAYFSGNDYSSLPVIENYENLRRIQVPKGVIMTTKTVPLRTDRFSYYSDDTEANDQAGPSRHSDYGTQSPASPPTPSMSSPLVNPGSLQLSMPNFHARDPNQRVILPPLSAMGYPGRSHTHERTSSSSSRGGATPVPASYTPLSSEDRRVLDRFRIGL
ncbi:uncharacterized protein BT62DRAFT_314614 [Guyanagaster necrorhizus]|uniref:cAMP-independent regulatory protein pac2 n=1 Tax=Guyanagaster necrorhizus TaxID=856835 RepID=A0A9P8AQF0_9AGAR|nr:uncharacterized protein BT62DRAFT_314614 [Guyanagaster necrorhizus MCA 3950]KAG7443781.1 hypothetical protein BT62DRAFT_314614 [Guyanagaster necrorhizus MCA 3950]